MKRSLAAMSLSLCGWLLWNAARPELPPVAPCDPLGRVSAPQLTAPGDVTPGDVGSLEDAQLLKQLADQGGALIDAGKTVDAEVLVKQLEYDRCELALPSGEEVERDPAALYAAVRPSVVVVAGLFKCPRCEHWHAAPASGFVISADGAIVTSHHVIDETDKKTFVVMTADGHVYPVTRVLAANRSSDLAILKVEAAGLKPLPLSTDPPAIGTPIGVISHPAAHFYSLSSGIVSRQTRVRIGQDPVDALQITADFARGSSGAPVLNGRGQVVGVVRSTESIYYSHESGQQKNLQMVFKICIPAKSVRKLITVPSSS